MNNVNLQRYALIAEIVGGLAVVITLIFLILEIRANTEAVRINSYDQLVKDVAAWRLNLANNPHLLDVISRSGVEPISESESLPVRSAFISLFQTYERAFIQFESGYLTELMWERFRRAMCETWRRPDFQEDTRQMILAYTSDTFGEALEKC